MQITLEVPEDIAQQFCAEAATLSRVAIEALALEGARSGKLSTGQIRRLLGLGTRSQADAFLKEHGVFLAFTPEDVEDDVERSRRFRESWSSPTPRR